MRCTADLRSREGGQFGLITKKGVASEVVQFPPVVAVQTLPPPLACPPVSEVGAAGSALRFFQASPLPYAGFMQLSEDCTEILVNGKPKYSARSIRFLLGSDVCVLCIASAATANVSSRCAECGYFPKATVRTGFRLNEHRLDGKMRKPRTREVTKIEQDDFDNEAKLLFKSLGLDESGRGHVEHDKYCPLNEIYRRVFPPPRPPCSCARTRSRAEARSLCSRGEGKGTIFVGNKDVASTRNMLEGRNITHIVNCTVSRSTFRAPMPTRMPPCPPACMLMLVVAALSQELLPNYFEAEAGMSYLRFPINLWMQRVTGCTPGPSNHSTLRARPAPRALHARSTPESILDFLKPFFDFVDKAVDSGGSVLVHCVAGAHRAGTAGCLLLMHYHQLAVKVRVDTLNAPPPMEP